MAAQKNSSVLGWRADFFTGLAIILPAVLSAVLFIWLFGSVSRYTNILLVVLPDTWTHAKLPDGELGDIYWYWTLIALALTVVLICFVGRLARYYLGRKIIQAIDRVLLRIPLLNRVYGTIKQVNDSFQNNKSSFKQVVLVPFPHARSRSLAFVTGEQKNLGAEKLVSVFIPTTPNPTSGFLMLVPESEVVKLDISVAEGIKFIISLGAISPDTAGHTISLLPPEAGERTTIPTPIQ